MFNRFSKKLIVSLSLSLFVITGCVSHNDQPAPITNAAAMNTSDNTVNDSIPKLPNTQTMSSPYALPGDKVFTQFPTKRAATGNKLILVDPNIPAWAAYDAEGNLIKTGEASAGQDYCPDEKATCRTVTGTFKVYAKGGADCKSSVFPLATHGGAPMPYCMHFYQGYALHGSNEMEDYDASHGCVRMIPSSAKWLSENFVEIGTTVIILPYNHKNSHA